MGLVMKVDGWTIANTKESEAVCWTSPRLELG